MSDELWAAPSARRPVRAVVAVPGSKSVTNRALVLAALSPGRTDVLGPLRSRDAALMTAGVTVLGASVAAVNPDGDLTVLSSGPPLDPTAATVDVGNAGTVARFLPPLAAVARGEVHFDGDPRMRDRPLGPLLAALRDAGADVADGGRGALPITVRGSGRVAGGDVTLDASASSQFISGLLLAAPAYERGLVVRHAGPPLPSRPQIAMTVRMLRAAGAAVDDSEPDVWRVAPGTLAARRIRVEPDLSSAAPFCAAALVTGGQVTIPGWPRAADQPGAALPSLLGRMGATCTLDERGLTVTGGPAVAGIDASLADAGELVPVLTALAAVADGPSRFRGVAHLRGQETDRLAALATEIGRLGGDVRETPDGLEVRPRPLHGGVVSTYDDHRMAMAAAVLGLIIPGVLVENVGTTAKTLPDFPALWAELLR